MWTRENGGSLDFNFILLPSPAVDENWGLPTYLLHSLSSGSDAMYNWNFLSTANSLTVSTYVCAQWDFLLTSFVCSLLNCEHHF